MFASRLLPQRLAGSPAGADWSVLMALCVAESAWYCTEPWSRSWTVVRMLLSE